MQGSVVILRCNGEHYGTITVDHPMSLQYITLDHSVLLQYITHHPHVIAIHYTGSPHAIAIHYNVIFQWIT